MFIMSKKSGIYQIINKLNGRVYYGSAKKFKQRKWSHFSLLRRNKHDNSFLQRDFNKCGEETFEFKIILYCDIENLLFYEQKFLDKYFDNCSQCYNQCPTAGSSLGYKHSYNSLVKMSGKNNHNFGLTGSFHPKSKTVYQYSIDGQLINSFTSLTEASKCTKTYIRGISSVCNGKLPSANEFLWTFADEQIPVFNVINNSKRVYQICKKSMSIINEYKSIAEAGRCTGIITYNISAVCNNRVKTAGGYVWKFVNHETPRKK